MAQQVKALSTMVDTTWVQYLEHNTVKKAARCPLDM